MKKLIFSLTFITSLSLSAQENKPLYLDYNADIEERIDDAMSRMTLEEKIRILHAQSKFSSAGIPRLGFPTFWTDDGPHGIRPDVLWDEWVQAGHTNDSCVAFPALTCLASTFNPDLAYEYGRALGEEARYRGKDMVLGPGVNINRNPFNGRNFEYMGEDPFLASQMVVPYVQGLQSTGTSACVKHYLLNNDEIYRNNVNVIVSERALHEIYLPAFHAAVTKANVWAIMGSYNLFNNEHCCHNDLSLNKILKQDWNFDGVVLSDWGGCHNTEQAVKNGLDMEFGSWTDGMKDGLSNAYDQYFLANSYYEGIKNGTYTDDELNDKVRRILRLFFRTTMSNERAQGFLCSEEHYKIAKKIAQDGIVLLQNKGDVLPIDLTKTKKILVVGENAIKPMTVGGGSSSLKVQKEISPLEGLKERLKNENVEIIYERGYIGDPTSQYDGVTMNVDLKDSRTEEQLIADAINKAKDVDYVIIFGGLNKAEHNDCEGADRQNYDLPYNQSNLVRELAKANKKVVYVNISGTPVNIDFKDKVPAIVQGWYLGSEAGDALAEVLLGDVNPSGRLPFTWWATIDQCPAHSLNTYPGTWRDGEQIIDEEYKEGIYVGYRWIDKENLKPLFSFGYGLSYTTFSLSDLKISNTEITRDDTITVLLKVKNTGKKAGAEVVELFIHQEKPTIDRPYKELKAFAKIFLEPDQEGEVEMNIDVSSLSYYDEKQHQWTADNGDYTILVGSTSDNLPLKSVVKLK